MALVEFINDSEPYLNAENLNNNFNELAKSKEYSLNEIEVGKWIDGKPIYRKVFVNTFNNVDVADFPVSITFDINPELILNIENIYNASSWFAKDSVMSTTNGSLYNSMGRWVLSKSTKSLNLYSTISWDGTITVYTILEYTKA